MEPLTLSILMLALVGFGLVTRRLDGSPLTGPFLFTLLGFVLSSALIGVVSFPIAHDGLHLLAEITLVLVLFSDASSIDLRQLRRDHNLPVRMLLIGMPLTIGLGTLAALWLFPVLSVWEAALLAAILTPTDAALGQAVVSNEVVPVRIRQALNVESGLNDGIALPFVLIFAALAGGGEGSGSATEWSIFALMQVGLGPLMGVIVGGLGGLLVARCYARGWLADSAEGMVAVGLAFSAFGLAELVGGNGFISAFVAGLVFGNVLQKKCMFLYEFAESEGQILILLTFLMFGNTMIPHVAPHWSWVGVLFGVLALTVLRMVPVQLSLIGAGLRAPTVVFLGWFGPRGLASILFVLIIAEEAEIAHYDQILAVVVATIVLSIVLHGVTAGPAARRYGQMAQRMGQCEENRPVSNEPFATEVPADAGPTAVRTS